MPLEVGCPVSTWAHVIRVGVSERTLRAPVEEFVGICNFLAYFFRNAKSWVPLVSTLLAAPRRAAGSANRLSFLSLSWKQHEAGIPVPRPHGPPPPGWLLLCPQHLQREPAYLCGLCRQGVYFPGQEAGLQGPSDHHGCLLGPL